MEFYIAAMGHEEWGLAHCVFGEVLDMTAVDAILALHYHEFK
jgi:hypothetical protein